MMKYKLDSRVLVQIEENFKVCRETATETLYIRKVDGKGEMYYLERRLSVGNDDFEPNSPGTLRLKPSDGILSAKLKGKVNNRESTNTKEATSMTVVVQEEVPPTKWFFGLF
jgi:hypothetical protein